jgi:hypothetical protein
MPINQSLINGQYSERQAPHIQQWGKSKFAESDMEKSHVGIQLTSPSTCCGESAATLSEI